VNHADHVRLIEAAVRDAGPAWADLGSGEGAFTLALAELLGDGGRIWSVDRDAAALARQEEAMRSRFPSATVAYLDADFTRPLPLAGLDGVVMANALHFVRHKEPVLELVARCLRPGGRFVLVEYDADVGNPWVPHPVSFTAWSELAGGVFDGTRLVRRVPSRFLGSIYSAVSLKRSHEAQAR
jgi:ubiquinone/menaquinone biosynthesis C-methylase UbiE